MGTWCLLCGREKVSQIKKNKDKTRKRDKYGRYTSDITKSF